MKVEKRVHPLYKVWQKCPIPIYQIVGEIQYIYSSKKGKISLVELPNYLLDGVDWWEIYCLEGNLFKDIERFRTKEGAEVRLRELLE